MTVAAMAFAASPLLPTLAQGAATDDRQQPPARPAVTVSDSPVSSSTVAPPEPAAIADDLTKLLALAGDVPARGAGTFSYAGGTGAVLGRSGPLRRFRVGVERGSNEDVAGLAAQVEAVLGDGRSWAGGGRVRLQRVSGGDPYDFTVLLATRDTAG
jgi:hypothetical protein